jgi:NitT/TauT family transport system permease protein
MTAISTDTPIRPAEKPRATRQEIVDQLVRDDRRRRRLEGPAAVGMVIVSVVGLVAIWQLVVVILQPPAFVLPSPLSVFQVFFAQLPLLATQALPTLAEVGLGFAITVAIFVPVGIAIAQSRWIEGLVSPLLVISQSTPMIALAPLLITWGGLGITPKVIMVVLICFFPVVVNTVVGVKSVAPEIVELGRSMGASPLAMLVRVRLPSALPSIFAGLRVAITLSVIGAIVGEFAGADSGLGRLIVDANGRLNTALVFAAVISLAIIGLALYKVIERIEWVAIPWHREKRDRNRH